MIIITAILLIGIVLCDSHRIGILLPFQRNNIGLPSHITNRGAINLALSQSNITLNFTQDTHCMDQVALNEMMNIRNQVDVIFGPVCEEAIEVVAMMATYWKISMITWTPTHNKLHQLDKYSSLVSILGTYEDISKAISTVLRHFNWKTIGILSTANNIYEKLTETSRHFFESKQISVKKVVTLKAFSDISIKDSLRTLKRFARIIILFIPEDRLNSVMNSAEAEDMINGEYVFIDWKFSPIQNQTGLSSTPLKRQTLESLLQIGPFTPHNPAYNNFSSLAAPVDEFAVYLYDAIRMYAAVAASRSISNTTNPLNLMNYSGLTGHIRISKERKALRTYFVSQYQGRSFQIVANLTDGNLTTIRPVVWLSGSKPSDTPVCGFSGSGCDVTADDADDTAGIVVGACVGTLMALACMIGAFVLYRKMRFEKELMGMLWKVNQNEIKMRKHRGNNGNIPVQSSGTHPKKKLVRMETRGTLGFGSSCSLDRNLLYAPIGNYKGSVVAVKNIQRRSIRLSRDVLRDLKTLRELHHDNLNQFVGASLEPQDSYILSAYCAKGSLQDVLENDDIKLDLMFKMSFALDLARGMEFLHKSALKSHGNLKSSNCVIDSRWVLKITDYGAITTHPDEPSEEIAEHEFYSKLLWTAPELLRLQKTPYKGTAKGDVYSFGIILQEIFLRVAPYFFNEVTSTKEIINRVRKHEDPPFRPYIPSDSDLPNKAELLMRLCWHENPESRPDFHVVRKRLVDLNKGKKINIMDNMIQMLEAYSNNLEQLVTERTEELAQEKQKTDRLLYSMLPPLVAEQLKRGESVQPVCYDDVSIFFSDIVGFTTIANQSEPLQVVDLLNDLYTTFDEIIARHDVYKVETIGDAYMCTSGLPRLNGKRHSGEIANMALDLLNCVTNFKIRHKPRAKLQLRIGLHTGGCAAGVVGVAMPRYCLFGDTVNMASRMESTGKALHIHVSEAMNTALEDLNWGFMTLERGIIEVKGKGLQKTYWLIGKKSYTKPLPKTMLSLQQKWKDCQESGRPLSPTESHISDRDHSDSMYGRAFRKTSIAISFLHSLSHDNSSLDGRSVSELSVQDLNVSCGSIQERKQSKDKASPSENSGTLAIERTGQNISGELKIKTDIIKTPPCGDSGENKNSAEDVSSTEGDGTVVAKDRKRKFAFSIPKIEIT